MSRLDRITIAFSSALPLLLGGCAMAWPGSDESLPKDIFSTSLSSAAASAEVSGDFQSALTHYRTLYERSPKDRDLALKLARATRLSGEPRQAAVFLEQFVRANGSDVDSHIEMARTYLATDQLTLASRNVTEAMNKSPNNWEAFSLLGIIHDYKGETSQARDNYEKALSLSPDNPNVLNNLGLSMAMAGDLNGGIDMLEKARGQAGASPHIRQNLALLLAMRGDITGSERFARKDMSADMVRANLRYFRALAEGAKR